MSRDKIDADFVVTWAGRYPKGADDHVLEVVHPAVRSAGYFTARQAEDVIRWKSKRTITFLRRNEPDDVKAITKMALDAPEALAHRVLGLLHGVRAPVASALLTVARPDTFTVIDELAMRTLRAHGEWGSTWPYYVDYLGTCRELATRCGTNLRTLDRALWAWGRADKRGQVVPPMCPDEDARDASN